MFVPCQYHEPDGSWTVDLVRQNPLAQLISNGVQVPYVTHVPIILDPTITQPPPELPGIVLWGHMNRANPHWLALRPDMPVVVTFTGPHAYVSPTVYEKSPAAPTWNFTAVHVHGTLRKIHSEEETLTTVKSTVRAFERKFGTGWDMSGSVDHFRRILPGVGAFRITVSRADAMFKLSQEQQPDVRDRVLRHFTGSQHDLTAMMAMLPTEVNQAG